MRSLNFVSIRLTVGLVLGIILGFYFETGVKLPFCGSIGFLVLMYFFKDRRSGQSFPIYESAVLLGTVCLGLLVVSLSLKPPRHYSEYNGNRETVWQLKVNEVLKSSAFAQNYIVEVMAVGKQAANGKLLLRLWADSTAQSFFIDDELLVYSKSNPVFKPLNPHQFDYKKYLEKQGVLQQIRTDSEQVIKLEHPSRTIWGMASEVRNTMVEKLKGHPFGSDELAIIQALLLGQRKDISESTYNDYKNAGAVHILAVSGLHVGIFLLLLEFLLTPLERLRNGKFLKFVAVVLLLWSYAFIAGLSASIVRAVTMFSFFAYALYLDRPTNSFNIIALSMFFILLIKPLMLFQVGFQMSYAAVMAIVWIYPKLQRFWFPRNWLVSKVWQLLSVSIAAQLGVLPISLFYFHQFPSLFFVSNLLIVPFLGLILGMGILVILLSLINYLPVWFVTLYNWVIGLMNAIVRWVANHESFIIKDIPFDAVQLVLYYFLFISLVALLSLPKWKYTLAVGIGILGLQTHAIWNKWELNRKENVLLLHQSKNTILFHQQGEDLYAYAKDTLRLGRLISSYAVSERCESIHVSSLKNFYHINEQHLYVMDSLGLCPQVDTLDYLLLTQSPKVNLERVLDSMAPKVVLADGSSFKSFINRWKKTCSKKGIPFHYTGEKGFFSFKPNYD